MNQTERKAILTQQNGECVLCTTAQQTPKGMCYVPEQNVLICRPCSTYLHSYKAAIKRGVTPGALIAFLERKSAPELLPGTKAKKLRSAQLDGLQFILNGQSDLSIDEFCRLAGVSESDAMQQIANR